MTAINDTVVVMGGNFFTPAASSIKQLITFLFDGFENSFTTLLLVNLFLIHFYFDFLINNFLLTSI